MGSRQGSSEPQVNPLPYKSPPTIPLRMILMGSYLPIYPPSHNHSPHRVPQKHTITRITRTVILKISPTHRYTLAIQLTDSPRDHPITHIHTVVNSHFEHTQSFTLNAPELMAARAHIPVNCMHPHARTTKQGHRFPCPPQLSHPQTAQSQTLAPHATRTPPPFPTLGSQVIIDAPGHPQIFNLFLLRRKSFLNILDRGCKARLNSKSFLSLLSSRSPSLFPNHRPMRASSL